MTITNGYVTLQQFKDAAIPKATADSIDDSVIEDIIENTSRFIDGETNRTFYARTETRKYNVPRGMTLALDDDLISVTTLTNGNDVAIASTKFILEPANSVPKYAIKLKESAGYLWVGETDGDTEQVIDVAGSWGYATTAPNDIRQACLDISIQAYLRRMGKNNTGTVNITAAGVIISPQDVPQQARRILNHYKRRT